MTENQRIQYFLFSFVGAIIDRPLCTIGLYGGELVHTDNIEFLYKIWYTFNQGRGCIMTVFLTSHIGGSIRKDGQRIPSSLITGNNLVTNLKYRWPKGAKVLFIAADPNNIEKSESYRNAFLYAFPFHGMPIETYAICDCRNKSAAMQLANYNVIILSGGHVPTQNTFFQKIGLKDKLNNYDGIVIGISAGTMNCADIVYAHPELDGEAIDSKYQRFIPGLGLTKRMILPHYQMIKDDMLDNLRVFEDIAYPDSIGREFYALNDGSYILSENGIETLYGEAYRIKDGDISLICRNNETLIL